MPNHFNNKIEQNLQHFLILQNNIYWEPYICTSVTFKGHKNVANMTLSNPKSKRRVFDWSPFSNQKKNVNNNRHPLVDSYVVDRLTRVTIRFTDGLRHVPESNLVCEALTTILHINFLENTAQYNPQQKCCIVFE